MRRPSKDTVAALKRYREGHSSLRETASALGLDEKRVPTLSNILNERAGTISRDIENEIRDALGLLPLHVTTIQQMSNTLLAETVRNRRDYKVPQLHICTMMPLRGRPIANRKKLWERGTTIRIGFMSDVDPAIQSPIMFNLERWLEYADTLKFTWMKDPRNATIRISCAQSGSWSYVGTDATRVDYLMPTMNFGWFDRNTSDEEYTRVVMHEGGHMLGLLHEQGHPEANIEWDKDAVYAAYKEYGWNRRMVDDNVFSVFDSADTLYSKYDPDSIMQYPIPPEFTLDGFSVGWNSVPSAMDKNFMRQAYGKSKAT